MIAVNAEVLVRPARSGGTLLVVASAVVIPAVLAVVAVASVVALAACLVVGAHRGRLR